MCFLCVAYPAWAGGGDNRCLDWCGRGGLFRKRRILSWQWKGAQNLVGAEDKTGFAHRVRIDYPCEAVAVLSSRGQALGPAQQLIDDVACLRLRHVVGGRYARSYLWANARHKDFCITFNLSQPLICCLRRAIDILSLRPGEVEGRMRIKCVQDFGMGL